MDWRGSESRPMDDATMDELVWLILTLPLRFFWWALQRDLGLLEAPPATSDKARTSSPSSPPTVWDLELDGPDLR